jgi:hypothetical protein
LLVDFFFFLGFVFIMEEPGISRESQEQYACTHMHPFFRQQADKAAEADRVRLCTTNASATPVKIATALPRVAIMKVAKAALSGSSAMKITVKIAINISKLIWHPPMPLHSIGESMDHELNLAERITVLSSFARAFDRGNINGRARLQIRFEAGENQRPTATHLLRHRRS